MKRVLIQCQDYCIYNAGKEYLYDVAKFVIKENYKHHIGEYKMTEKADEEVKSVYKEELLFSETSQIYIAENQNNQMIGCIRVMKWDGKSLLPVHKIFNINPLNYIKNTKYSSFWHIGRFAVDSCKNIPSISLFKKLMMYAIYPICRELDGYMIAECDSKLLRVMNLLGIDTVCLGSGINYLGSETIPVYANKEGLSKFYHKYYHSCISETQDENIRFQLNIA
jgi:hypothetical protein